MPKTLDLFAVTRWLLKAATVFGIFVVAILVLSIVAILVAMTNLDGNHLGIPENLEGISRGDALSVGALAIVVGIVCVLLVLFALRATTEIVETTISGDPFVKENARRLERIGWLLLAFIAVQYVANLIIHRIVESKGILESLAAAHQLSGHDVGRFSFGDGLSPVGLLAVLLIFVLGRIFRRGSEMRAELEGTV